MFLSLAHVFIHFPLAFFIPVVTNISITQTTYRLLTLNIFSNSQNVYSTHIAGSSDSHKVFRAHFIFLQTHTNNLIRINIFCPPPIMFTAHINQIATEEEDCKRLLLSDIISSRSISLPSNLGISESFCRFCASG